MKAADPKNPTLAELLAGVKVRHPSDEHVYFSSYSGGPCYLKRPDLSHITLSDIANVLARTPRWGGRTNTMRAYSVAQHSVYVSQLCNPEHALIGLLHDATEAYLGDVMSPLKRLLPEYKQLEQMWALEIGMRAGVGPALAKLPEDVLRADLLMLEVERHDLMAHGESWHWWGLEDRPTDMPPIQLWDESYAYVQFMVRFKDLTGRCTL